MTVIGDFATLICQVGEVVPRCNHLAKGGCADEKSVFALSRMGRTPLREVTEAHSGQPRVT